MLTRPEDALAPLRAAPERSGLFIDFDGTLSPIVPRPEQARPAPGAPQVLARLAERFAVVAVVSGRAARDLSALLPGAVEVYGLHGAERARAGRIELAPQAARFAPLMATVLAEARAAVARLGLRGAVVEDKGVIVALHHRAAEDPAAAARALDRLAAELAARHGLVTAPGRMVVELRPPVRLSKADVVATTARARALRAVAFAGDDTVDLPAFDALDDLAAEGVAAVRIAVASAEAPPELLARADVVVGGPGGLVALLGSLLD